MLHTHKLAMRILITLTSVMLAMAALFTSPLHTYAGVGGCRSDPTAVLSDGTHVKMATAIDTDASNVSAIHYLVHGPAGTTMDRVVYAGPHTIPDDVTFMDDSTDGTYTVDVTADASVSATVETTVQIRSSKTTQIGTTNVAVHSVLTP